jgi:phosphate transport system permease protein
VRELADLRVRSSWRTVKNTIATCMLGATVVIVAIPLALVVWAVLSRGAHVAFEHFPDFFTKDIAAISRRPGGGMGPAIVGTLIVTGLAALIAIPLGVLGAVYLHEYGGNSAFSRVVRFMAMVMTGVPSVVMGLFIYIAWTIRSNFWGEGIHGYSAFGGALALACLMLPVVIGSTEQMLRLVPNSLREASYALGATKSRTIMTIVLPAALPGIVSGALLAIARAAGETAPLLFAVGAATSYHLYPFDGANTALPMQIFGNATSAFAPAQDRAWGAALVLVMVTFTMMVAARLFTRRFAIKR